MKQLLFSKEPPDLPLRRLRAVRGVGDVHHHVPAERATDGAGCGLAAVGPPEHVARLLHHPFTLDDHSDDRRTRHERLDLRVERLVGDVRVVFAENRRREFDHLATGDAEARLLEARDHLAAEAAQHGVGLEEDE